MKKLVILAVLFMSIVFVTYASAATYLACDPQTGVLSYEVEVDGITVDSNYQAEPDGSILYQVDSLSNGAHTFRLKAIGQGGWPSDWSLPFSATKPDTATNARIEVR